MNTINRIYTRGTNLIYRRKIPVELKPYIKHNEYKRALVPDIDSAMMIAAKYDSIFNKMIASVRLGYNDLNQYIEALDIQEKKPIKKPNIYIEFMFSKQGIADSSYREYKQQLELFQVLLPAELNTLSYKHIDSVKQHVLKLPKRNIQKYRDMSLKELIQCDVTESDRISVKSQNEYLKTLRALLKFAEQRNYIKHYIEVKLFTNKTTARNQRQVLNSDDISMLFNDPKMGSMAKISYYSGMRLSEVYKCSIKLINDVLCFDLTDRTISLKTDSSYRVIPIHKDIIDDVHELISDAVSVKSNNVTRSVSKLLNSKGKTLYSLRHTFATVLASKGIETHVIAELLGHTPKGMTAGRYVKGYDVHLLSNYINNL